jgi:hypothetical protein
VGAVNRQELERLVERATVDCYNESEQITGWLTMLEEHLRVPFVARVLRVDVQVSSVDLTVDGRIVALCSRGPALQAVPILDLSLPDPAPAGAEWIEAYRYWATGS